MDEEPIGNGSEGGEEAPDERQYARDVRRQRQDKAKAGAASKIPGQAGEAAQLAAAATKGDIKAVAEQAKNLAVEKAFQKAVLYCYGSWFLIPVGFIIQSVQLIMSGVKNSGWDGIGGCFGLKKGNVPALTMGEFLTYLLYCLIIGVIVALVALLGYYKHLSFMGKVDFLLDIGLDFFKVFKDLNI